MRADDDDSFEGVPELFIFTVQLRQRTIKQDMAVLVQGLHGICNGKTLPHSQDVLKVYRHCPRRSIPSGMEYAEECGLEMNGHPTVRNSCARDNDSSSTFDLIKNYIITEEEIASIKKIVPRYMQYRAADRAVERLLDPPEQEPWAGEGVDPRPDPRGGYIWHTQGSGKSLTMAWIARKMQSMEYFNGWKIVYVTDRSNLEEQLSETPAFEDKSIRIATDIQKLKQYLSDENSGIIFGMIQKMQDPEDVDHVELTDGPRVVEEGNKLSKEFEGCNLSHSIAVIESVMVDRLTGPTPKICIAICVKLYQIAQ